MNKKIYTCMAFVAYMVSAPLFADVATSNKHPAANTESVTHNQDGNSESAESAHRKFVADEEERSGHIGYSGFEEKAAVNGKQATDTVTVAPSNNPDKASTDSAHRKFVEEEEERSGHVGYSGFEENKAIINAK